jgi:hypothetical protein
MAYYRDIFTFTFIYIGAKLNFLYLISLSFRTVDIAGSNTEYPSFVRFEVLTVVTKKNTVLSDMIFRNLS